MRWPPRSVAERFWDKVDRSGGPNACWIWQGACSAHGYGYFRIDRETLVRAHRFVFALTWEKDIADGVLILHSCDVRRCVNPLHLREGTSGDNLRDQYERFRRPAKPLKAAAARWRQRPSPPRRRRAA